jgi:hypothetical protein
MSSLDNIRSTLNAQTSETVTLADLMTALRFMGVLAVIGAALAAYLWSRMEVTRLSVALDESRSELARAEVLHERLLLERRLLRQPGHLADEAAARGMTAPKAVVDMGAGSLQ